LARRASPTSAGCDMRGVILETRPMDVFCQMAADEILAVEPRDAFVLRFFNWNQKAVTFGYAQFFSEVKKQLPDWAAASGVTRRPTGGGIVLHDSDITFSCSFPCETSVAPMTIYSRLHTAVCAELSARGIGVDLAKGSKDDPGYRPSNGGHAGECFKNPVALDIVRTGGEKVLGGAIRKFSGSALYQGSLQLAQARKREAELRLCVMRGAAKAWDLKWTTEKADGEFEARVVELARTKYRRPDWVGKF